jgi:PAS domain S-box-containing protein
LPPTPYWTVKRVFIYLAVLFGITFIAFALYHHRFLIKMNKLLSITIKEKESAYQQLEKNIAQIKNINNELEIAKELTEEREFRLKLATDSGKLAVWDWNIKENKMNWDNKMFQLYGINPETFPAGLEIWTSSLHPEDKDWALNECNLALKGEKDFNTSFRIVHPNGNILHLKAYGLVIRDNNGEPIRMIGINNDITESKNAEKELIKAKNHAEESDRLKTAFLQNMSHEIRTPMNAIMGFSELLVKNYNNKEKLEKFSEIITQRCNDLLDIISDILDIAKIESGQVSINTEECNIDNLFAELGTFFSEHQKRIGKQHIKFGLYAHCNPSKKTIITDKVKLKQIFINLIGNAFKFTDSGAIEGGCMLDAKQNLIFYVSDTGIGIPNDQSEVIFERFTQLAPRANKLVSGTGLGLSIVKGLVNLLGGNIWLESELGKGTTFFFSCPYKIGQATFTETNFSSSEQTYQFQNKTILVVEDDTYNSTYINEILFHTGIHIINTELGSEAVQIVKTQHPNIVLMDIRLPDMTGYEATRQIKQHNPNIKIIAQTAYAAIDDKNRAFEAGCNDYISKPLQQNLLLAMINKHML